MNIKPFLIAMLLLVPPMAAADMLERHLWQDRLLILVAPSAEHPPLHQQREVLGQRQDALQDRDLRIYQLIGDQGLRDGEPIAPQDAAQLRRHFGLNQEDSMILLVGLDGGVKRRAPLATPLSELFMQIDGMPMRRADIRAKRAAGMTVTEP